MSEKPVRVYRLHTGVAHTGSSSSGRVTLFDDEAALRDALLDAYLDVIGSANGTAPDVTQRRSLATRWRRHRRADDEHYPRVTRIIAVQQHVGDEWVDVRVEFTDPAVHLYPARADA